MPAHSKIWTAVTSASLLLLVAAAVLLHHSFRLTALSDVIQCLLLLSGTLSFLPHVLKSRGRMRLFWALIMSAIAMWFSYQLMWTYIEVWQRREVPELFAGDIVLFLHIVPLMAALALRPQVPQDEHSARVGRLDFALLIVWWVYLYVLLVIPWQYVVADDLAYSRTLNSGYLVEKVAFLVSLAILWWSSKGGWRSFYASLFGASLTYSASSYVANWAIPRNLYYSGSLYDIPLAISMAWITVIGLWTPDREPQESSEEPSTGPGVWLARLGMAAVFSLPAFAAWTLLDAALPHRVRAFRLVLTLAAALLMGIMVFTRQHLLDGELRHLLKHSRESIANLKRLQALLTESEKLASIGQLVGGAAHELNNPITAMLGYSELLLATALSPEQHELAAGIAQQVRRTRSLVSSLLSFATQGPAAKAPVDLNTLVRTAIKISQPQWQTLKVEVRADLQPDLPTILGDSNQLLQVCIQILNHVLSREQLGTGGSLAVATHHQNGTVSVRVSGLGRPTGNGINTASAGSKLHFDQGLGETALGACQEILQEHQGRILFQKQEKGGSTIRLELPVSSPAPAKPHPARFPAILESQPFA
ncbi:MAG TPA: histidine kinase dimerization/phospho-acceptor domain-containing protein [Candidatus Aquilonibacter sp.]|nr:histidine kinase dimerization/phospho-acceptor domain-containing protein [Candidatus Aquilonibacter sp.]